MKKSVGSVFLLFLLSALFFSFSADTAWAAKVRHRKQIQIPAGWKYEAGYTMWRMKYKLPADQHTYIKYRRDRVWRHDLHRRNRAGEIALDTLDWTNAEVMSLWENYGELLKIHPAGIDR